MTLQLCALLVLLMAGGAASAVDGGATPNRDPDATTAAIASLLSGPEPLTVDGQRLDVRALRQLYEPRGYRPVWSEDGGRVGRGTDIAAALAHAAAHGLDPVTYHAPAVARRAATDHSGDRAALDLLASDGTMRLVAHLRAGAIPPATIDGETAIDRRPVDAQALTLAAAEASDIPAFLDGVAPQTPAYHGLLEALSRYREIAKAGGWRAVPTKGPALRPGESDQVVPLVRQRLAATGELTDGDAGDPTHYDDALVAAVKEFQARHGLPADGVLGATTRAALAIPVEGRIGQLIANLERARWFPDELGQRYVAVEVPSFELVVVENGSPVLRMPVVVGRKDRRTPLLAAQITELIFNPSWTVPPTLLKKDFLPKMQRNPAYLTRKGIRGQRAQPHPAPAPGSEESARQGEVPHAQRVLRVPARHQREGSDAAAAARAQLRMRSPGRRARAGESPPERRPALDPRITEAVPRRL